MADSTTAERGRLAALLQNFLRDGRLIRLPARYTKRREVLRHLAMRDFQRHTWYSEAEINEVLKSWCEGAEGTDFVSVRRYLIDYQILDREDGGKYWLIGDWKVPATQ